MWDKVTKSQKCLKNKSKNKKKHASPACINCTSITLFLSISLLVASEQIFNKNFYFLTSFCCRAVNTPRCCGTLQCEIIMCDNAFFVLFFFFIVIFLVIHRNVHGYFLVTSWWYWALISLTVKCFFFFFLFTSKHKRNTHVGKYCTLEGLRVRLGLGWVRVNVRSKVRARVRGLGLRVRG